MPSPRSHKSAARSAGPSRLANQELLDQEEDDDDGGPGGFDDYAPQEASPRQLSFTEMDTRDEDDEEEMEEDDDPPVVSPRREKGKGKAQEPVQDDEEDMEDDIAHGMDDVDMTPPESDEQPDARLKKKPTVVKEKPMKRQKENRDGECRRVSFRFLVQIV